MPTSLYLEVGADGWCMCFPLAFPGAGFKSPAPGVAVNLAPHFLRQEIDWLAGGGRPVAPGHLPPVTVAEVVTLPHVPIRAGDTEAIFTPEQAPLSAADLDRSLPYLEQSRKELLDLVDALPPPLLSWRPAPGKRSVMSLLDHVADAELFYVLRLDPPEADLPAAWERLDAAGVAPRRRLELIRSVVLERLDRLTEEDRTRVSRHDPNAEAWSARNVLRRLIWHERYHTRQLIQYLTM